MILGLLLLAVAAAAAVVVIAQNQSAMVDVHALGYTWHVHLYWVLVAGLVITGHDGRMITWAGLVIACAIVPWLKTTR